MYEYTMSLDNGKPVFEGPFNHKIKEGDKFVCTSDVVMDTGKVLYRTGVIYTSDNDDCITGDNGDTCHDWADYPDDDDTWWDYFQRCTKVVDRDYFQSVQQEDNPFKPEQSTYEGTELLIEQECNALKDLLIEKNRRYGDSAIHRGQIYDLPATVAIKARINDKLLRLKNLRDDDQEDVVQDLLGYFILLRIAEKKEQGK